MRKRKSGSSYAKKMLGSFVRPSGLRAFVLGVSLAVGGLAGGTRILVEGAEILKGVVALGIGGIGTLIALACVLEYSKR